MRIKRSILLLVVFSFIVNFVTLTHAQTYNVKDIVKKIDELYRSKTSYAKIEMQIETPNWKRSLNMEAWTMEKDKAFILINSPKKEQGIATLRIKNEMWNYLPNTDKVMKIPPSMMMGSWMGSDFTNDDLVHEFSMVEDYDYIIINPEVPQPDLIYIEFTPKEKLPVVWGKVIVAVRKSDFIPVWQKYCDEKGNLMRQMNFKDIKVFSGRKIPSIMEMIPQNKEGHKTVIKYLDAVFDSKLDDNIFTLRNLQKKR
jgi:outer membrane lipoprotein-sorting protein